MTKFLGFWEMQEGTATFMTFILVILAIGCIFVLWYKFRKVMWAFAISTVIAVIISALVPLITSFLLESIVPDLNISNWDTWIQIFWYGIQSSLFGIGLKFLINIGFDVARWEPFGKQS